MLININKKNKTRWLRFTEETNALDYLEKASFFTKQTMHDETAWKWVILATYSAMYGFAICTLRGTNPDRVLINTRRGKKLIGFVEAIKRCQNQRYMRMTVNSKCLQLSTEQNDSIDRLSQQFRNNFIHYIPTSWSIEISGMPKIIKDCLEVVYFLALETGNYSHLTQTQEKKIKYMINKSIKILNPY